MGTQRSPFYGTPKQVFEKIMDYQSMADSAGQIGVFSYGGMPHAMARANVELFADKVLPRLQRARVGEPIGTPAQIAA